MEYSLRDLKPKLITVDNFGIELILNPVTLNLDLELSEKFAEAKDIFNYIQANPMRLFDVFWVMLKNKNEFKNFDAFKAFIFSKAKTSEVSGVIYSAIRDNYLNAMPKIKNRARYDELLKINSEVNNVKSCYGIYYDKIAKRYSYTIDQFLDLTLSQLHILLKVSGDESYSEIEIQAALQGRKMRPKMEFLDIDDKEEKKLDDHANDLYERLKKDYQDKK